MWTCVKCGTKIDPGFEVCWNCGTTADGVEDPGFVKADDSAPLADPAYDPIAEVSPEHHVRAALTKDGAEIVEAYQAQSLMEAKFLADQLNEQGIPAMCDTQDMQDFMGPMDGNPRIWVRREDHAQARAWLLAYEEQRQPESQAE